jgi:hypothetical protein
MYASGECDVLREQGEDSQKADGPASTQSGTTPFYELHEML